MGVAIFFPFFRAPVGELSTARHEQRSKTDRAATSKDHGVWELLGSKGRGTGSELHQPTSRARLFYIYFFMAMASGCAMKIADK